MYKERRESISIKFYILIALIILIIIFAIILIIPHKPKKVTKSVEMELYSKQDMNDLKQSSSKTFYNNFKEFKEVSEKYFVKKVDALLNNQTITLEKLYDNHLITTLTDDKGNKCDSENSNIKLKKNSNNSNYKMVLNLVCGEEKAEITTYMGQYDYCDESYCEKKVEVKENNKKKPEKESENINESINDPVNIEVPSTPTLTNPTTMYEYVLTPNDKVGSWSEWSDWQKDKIDASLYKGVDTKSETKSTEYDCSTVRTERYISGYKETKYIAGYTTTTRKVGTVNKNGNVEAVYDTQTVPVYGTRKTPIYSTRNVGEKKTCKKDEETLFYRYRTFAYNKGINYVKYSSSDNDQGLINKGYTKTGKTK